MLQQSNYQLNSSFLKDNYLNLRNKFNYRGHNLSTPHPLYLKEINNGISVITAFLSSTILAQASLMRQKSLFNLSAEKCWNNSANNYTFSEAETCEGLLFKNDPILKNIEKFKQHVEVKLANDYENQVQKSTDIESNHKKFLLKMNHIYRYYFYYQAKGLFIDSLN